MMGDDLVEFLRAPLDEDEQMARSAEPGSWEVVDGGPTEGIRIAADDGFVVDLGAYNDGGVADKDDAAHIARHNPSRVLCDVEVKRRIISEMERLRSSLAMAQEDVRAAYAEREEMWERKAAALRERDDARRELAEAKAKLASLQAFADRCREKDWAYAAERARERDEARVERDLLKAELREWATRLAHVTGAVPAVDIAWKLRQIVGELEADRG